MSARHLGNTMEQERSRAPLFYLTAALFYFGVLVSLPLVLGAGGCVGTGAQADAGPSAAPVETAGELVPGCDEGTEAVDCQSGDPARLVAQSSNAGL